MWGLFGLYVGSIWVWFWVNIGSMLFLSLFRYVFYVVFCVGLICVLFGEYLGFYVGFIWVLGWRFVGISLGFI